MENFNISFNVTIPMLCGLLFGPIIGTVVGIITGIHRYTMGGFTALPCSLSCMFSGLISGFICYYYQKKKIPWIVIFTLGITVNILQMVMILLTAYPFSRALELDNTIGFPMYKRSVHIHHIINILGTFRHYFSRFIRRPHMR